MAKWPRDTRTALLFENAQGTLPFKAGLHTIGNFDYRFGNV